MRIHPEILDTVHGDARHEALVTAWAAYNSRTGRATARQCDRIRRQFPFEQAPTLDRMLRARGVLVPGEAVCRDAEAVTR